MPVRRKSNTNFVAEQPKQGWAFFEESGQWRRTPDPWGAPRDHFPKEYGDWFAVTKPAGWQPPAGTLAGESLLDGGAVSLNAAGGGSGGGTASGTKIGAGHKPQPYGWHGYYGETGGGFSGGTPSRNPAPPPSKAPAEVTWRNDDPHKPDPKMKDLHAPMRKTVEDMKTEVPKLESANVNSGRRPYDPAKPNDPHTQGRAVDINNINGVRVVNLDTATGPKGEQAREAATNLEEWAKGKDDVTEIIGPTGWWKRDSKGKMEPKIPANDREIKTLEEHKNHYHIGTKW